MSWVPKPDVDFSTSVHYSSSVADKLQSILEELWLHVRHILKLF